MNFSAGGYSELVRDRTTASPPSTAQAVRSIATVAGVVVLVLTLLALAVYAVVVHDLLPQMH